MCKWRTNIKWFTKALGVWATGCSERGSNKSGQVSHAWFLHPLSPKDAGISACSTFYSTFHSANTFWASWPWAALGKPKRICMYVVGTGSLRQGTRYDPKCGWTNCIIKQMAKPEISFTGVLKKNGSNYRNLILRWEHSREKWLLFLNISKASLKKKSRSSEDMRPKS